MNESKKTSARLFIIGAGASYGAGLPDASEILTQLIGYVTGPWMPIANRSPMEYFKPLLGPLMQVVGRLGRGSLFPLEELAADFEKALQRDRKKFAQIYAMLFQAIRELIYSRSCERASEFREFASHLRPGDLVVTFNWDVCLEIALAILGTSFTRSLDSRDEPDAVRILKIHGSVDDLIVKYGTRASIGPHSIAESYGLKLPVPPGRRVRDELVRLRTYDLPLRGQVTWDFKNHRINQEVFGECDPKPIDGHADLFPLQLEVMLSGDCSPFLLTPAMSRKLYDWAYANVNRVVARVDRPVESIFVIGYSFPSYDRPVFDVLQKMATRFGKPRTCIVNPAAHELPQDVLSRIFGSVELYPLKFEQFDWSESQRKL